MQAESFLARRFIQELIKRGRRFYLEQLSLESPHDVCRVDEQEILSIARAEPEFEYWCRGSIRRDLMKFKKSISV